MADEEAPLLSERSQAAHDAVYARFSNKTKRTSVAIVSWAGLVPMFVSGSFIPALPQIAADLNSTAAIASLTVSISVLTNAIGSLFWATYSGFYGRRPIYLTSIPIYVIGSFGVARSQSIPELMIWRVVQAFGCSSGMTLGSAVIGDMYKLEERGTAMGIFFGMSLLGPALAPFCGGASAHYASWRFFQYILMGCGLLGLFFIFAFLPETSLPNSRGMDKYRGNDTNTQVSNRKRFRWVWLNPFRSLALLRSPNILFTASAGALILLTDFVLLVPLSYTIGKRYGITNEALIGAFFLPAGLGNIIGAPLAGRLSDMVVIQWRERRDGVWVPEDRLRATLLGALLFVPISILLSGIITQNIGSTLGIILNLICLFMNGIGVDFVLSPTSAYLVDVMHSRSAEVMATANCFRSILIACSTMAILPLINNVGVLLTDLIAAALAWMGSILIVLTILHGDKMRAWMDIGYSTAETN